jgi:hypothetical protein
MALQEELEELEVELKRGAFKVIKHPGREALAPGGR